jgi:hypothetical protein
MNRIISIKGGSGAPEVAAIAAVVAHAESDAETIRAKRPTPPRPSSWVQAGRPRESHAPLPSHVYDMEPPGPGNESSEE